MTHERSHAVQIQPELWLPWQCLVPALPSASPCEGHGQPTEKEPGNILWMQMLLHPGSKASQTTRIQVAVCYRRYHLLDLLLVAEYRRQKRTQKALFPGCGELEIQCDRNRVCICALISGIDPA